MNYHFYRRKSFICVLRTVYLYMMLFVLLYCSSLIISCLNVLTKCVLSCSEDRMMLVGGKYDAGRSIVISCSEDIDRAVLCINIDVSSSFPLKKCILFCDSSNSLYICNAPVSPSGWREWFYWKDVLCVSLLYSNSRKIQIGKRLKQQKRLRGMIVYLCRANSSDGLFVP